MRSRYSEYKRIACPFRTSSVGSGAHLMNTYHFCHDVILCKKSKVLCHYSMRSVKTITVVQIMFQQDMRRSSVFACNYLFFQAARISGITERTTLLRATGARDPVK